MLTQIQILRDNSFNSNFEYDVVSETDNRTVVQDMTKDIWDITIRDYDVRTWDALRKECRSRTYKC